MFIPTYSKAADTISLTLWRQAIFREKNCILDQTLFFEPCFGQLAWEWLKKSTKKDKLDVIKQLFCFSRMHRSQNLDLFFLFLVLLFQLVFLLSSFSLCLSLQFCYPLTDLICKEQQVNRIFSGGAVADPDLTFRWGGGGGVGRGAVSKKLFWTLWASVNLV